MKCSILKPAFFIFIFLASFCGRHATAQQLITNGTFSQTTTDWTAACPTCIVEATHPESSYGGTSTTNIVAEIDDQSTFYQDVCILPDMSYIFSMDASRRTGNGAASNPESTTIEIDGLDASNNIVATYVSDTFTRTNTVFALTPVMGIPVITVPAGSGVVRLKIYFYDATPGAYSTLGMEIDNLSLVFQTPPAVVAGNAIAGADTTCINAPENFSISGITDTSITYTWAFGANSTPDTSTSATPSVSWSTPGNQPVYCILGNGVCPVDTSFYSVYVSQSFSSTTYDTTCTGVPYIFQGTSYMQTGVYINTFTSITGCDSTVTINLYVTPPITATVYDSICSGSSYAYNGNTYTTAGAYTNNFTTTKGCDSVATLNLYIRPVPAAPQVISPVYYCQFAVAAPLIVNGTNAIHWYATATSTAPLSGAPTPATDIAGDFNYYVSQTSDQGCESQRAEITVHVYQQPGPPTVTNQTYCQNAATMQLTAIGDSLLWYTVQGGTGSVDVPTPSAANTGDVYYYVTQTINGCESADATIDVHVTPNPPPPVVPVADYCQEQVPQDLNIQGSSLLWYLADTGGTGTATFPVTGATLSGATPYFVSQTVNGCESKRAVIYVKPCCDLYLPSAFSPNGDNVNDVFRIITDEANGINVLEFSIYDRWGARVYIGNNPKAYWDGTYNGVAAPIGTYFYYIIYSCGAGTEIIKKGEVTLVR